MADSSSAFLQVEVTGVVTKAKLYLGELTCSMKLFRQFAAKLSKHFRQHHEYGRSRLQNLLDESDFRMAEVSAHYTQWVGNQTRYQ